MSFRRQTEGAFSHRVSGRVEYITPKWLIDAIGPFDLDPCASEVRPWPIAKSHYTSEGLQRKWVGFVFVNPPYGVSNGERQWLEKLSNHNNGIALIFAKTETRLWQEVVFPDCSAILFLGGSSEHLTSGRIVFANTDGSSTGGHFAGSALIAFGPTAKTRLKKSGLPGFLMEKS